MIVLFRQENELTEFIKKHKRKERNRLMNLFKRFFSMKNLSFEKRFSHCNNSTISPVIVCTNFQQTF